MLYFIKHHKLEMNNMVFSANSFPGFTCHFDSKNESVTEEVDRKFSNSEKVKHFSFLKFPRLYAVQNQGVDQNDEERRRIKEFLSKEDKWDRVKRMYSSNEFGELSPELHYVLNGGIMCTLMGGFIGALESMKKRRDNFFKVNAATKYESEHLARRDLYDRMTLSGAKGFLRQGFRYGSFSTLYMLGTVTAANFNNKVTFWEHMACAAFLGSLSKINYGIKGMIAAGLIGGILGLLSGGVVKTAMWMSGITVEEMRYWQHGYYGKELSNKNTQPTKE